VENIIQADKLSFTYEDSEEGIDSVDFEIREGEVVLLTGNSGCGKSTLLRCLNGLIPNVTEGELSGDLRVEGKECADMPMHERNRVLGSVFQNPRSQFFTDNTTAELVFPMENYGMPKEEMEQRLEKLKREFRLEKLMDCNLFSLSSGERQLIALASSVALGQKVLLFDEPSANLDYGNAMRLGRIIRKMKARGVTVIVADHRFYYLNGMLDKVLFMDHGHLKVFGSESEFKNSGYNTRSFDIFSLDTKVRGHAGDGEVLAQLMDVSYRDIVRNVSVSLRRGEIAVLVGNNGAGKTTIAKLLCKSIKPSSGKVHSRDLPFFIMQDPDYQLFGTSVENELALVRNDPEKITECLEYLNLAEYREAHPFDLSGGQKQRLQIGMAMLCEREVILFDEPTSGLDVNSMQRVSEEIRRLGGNAAVLVISHDYEFIRNIADRILYLKDGTIKENFVLNDDTLDRLNTIFHEMEEDRKDEEA